LPLTWLLQQQPGAPILQSPTVNDPEGHWGLTSFSLVNEENVDLTRPEWQTHQAI